MPDHLDGLRIGVLALAAVIAGAVNAIAGGGSLISFPALLFAGYSPVTANITNAVALLPGYAGGSLAYRAELRGQGTRLRPLAAISVAGAVAGAVLLVAGPEALFQRIVPWLILGSCALLLAQPPLKTWLARRRPSGRVAVGAPLLACQGLAAVYGAYFGAGLGVILLAVLGILVPDELQRLNALKGLLSLIINLVAVAVFLAVGSVGWFAVALMAPLSFAGGQLGVVAARRLSERTLRLSVVAFGTAVGIRLAI